MEGMEVTPEELIEKAAEAAMNAPYNGETPTLTAITDAHPIDAEGWRDVARAVIAVVGEPIWLQGYKAPPVTPNPYRIDEQETP